MGTCARVKRRSGTIFNGMLGTVTTSQQCEMQATHMTVERATLVKTAGYVLHSLCTAATDCHVFRLKHVKICFIEPDISSKDLALFN